MNRRPDTARIRAALARSLHFRDLAADDLDRLAALGRTRSLHDDELLSRGGSRQDKLWLVIDGCVRLSSSGGPRGKEIVFALLGPGSYFGVGNVLRGKGAPTDARAVGATVVAELDGTGLLALFDERPRLWRHLATLLYIRLTLALLIVRDISIAPLPQRLTRRLLGQVISSGADPSGHGPVELRLTQRDLGRMLGTSRSRINGALKRLEKDGLIRIGYRTITLVDLGRLRGFSGPEVISF